MVRSPEQLIILLQSGHIFQRGERVNNYETFHHFSRV